MEGYIAEIRMFAGNFAPRDWAFCWGQIIEITQNTSLFSLLGTTYGGDGRTTFALPDFRARTPAGTGRPVDLPYQVPAGIRIGQSSTTLTVTQLPPHDHTAAIGNATATISVHGYDKTLGTGADSPSPEGNVLSDGGTNLYSTQAPNVNMNADSASFSNFQAQVAIGNTGGGHPIPTVSPAYGMNFIICTSGLYPERP